MANPVTNQDILNYLIDLSANIAHQFAIVESQNSSMSSVTVVVSVSVV